MSILNAFVRDDFVEVVVDTMSAIGPVGKAFLVPHMNVLIASRGHVLLPAGLMGSAAVLPSYDSLVDLMPTLVAEFITQFAKQKPDIKLELGEIVTAGWSDRRNRLDVTVFLHCDGAYRPFDTGGWHIAPALEFEVPPQTLEEHLALAERQAQRLRNEGYPAGGHLVLTRVARDGMMVRRCHLHPAGLGRIEAPSPAPVPQTHPGPMQVGAAP